MRHAPLALATVAVFFAMGCTQSPDRQITIVDGATVNHFSIRSAFAEYVELPGDHNELRLTLASYAVSCERWVSPGDNDLAVTVIVTTPADTPPTSAEYAWTGQPATGEPIKAAYALPKALMGRTSRLFEPGGLVKLTAVELEPHGTVSGTLAFEFPGVADRPSTRVDGAFDAKTCRLTFATR